MVIPYLIELRFPRFRHGGISQHQEHFVISRAGRLTVIVRSSRDDLIVDDTHFHVHEPTMCVLHNRNMILGEVRQLPLRQRYRSRSASKSRCRVCAWLVRRWFRATDLDAGQPG